LRKVSTVRVGAQEREKLLGVVREAQVSVRCAGPLEALGSAVDGAQHGLRSSERRTRHHHHYRRQQQDRREVIRPSPTRPQHLGAMRYSQEHPLATQLEIRDRNLLGFGSLIKQDPNLKPTSLTRDLVPQETHIPKRKECAGARESERRTEGAQACRKGGGERRSDCNLGSASVAKSSVEHCGGRKFLYLFI